MNTLALPDQQIESMIAHIAEAEHQLSLASTQYERIEIRDQARRAQVAAQLIGAHNVALYANRLTLKAEFDFAQIDAEPTARADGRFTVSDREDSPLDRRRASDIRAAYRGISRDEFMGTLNRDTESLFTRKYFMEIVTQRAEIERRTRMKGEREERRQQERQERDKFDTQHREMTLGATRRHEPPGRHIRVDSLTDLYHCDIRDLDLVIPAESVNWIITDPPYTNPEIYEELAYFAAYALAPGGSVLAMAGVYELPKIMAAITSAPGIEYQWTLAYMFHGRNAAVHPKKIFACGWRSIIWMVKPPYKGESIMDVVDVPTEIRNPKYHMWQQSLPGFIKILEKFEPKAGDVVVDPFLGGGTTAMAVLRYGGLRFIGSDIELECVETTEERLSLNVD